MKVVEASKSNINGNTQAYDEDGEIILELMPDETESPKEEEFEIEICRSSTAYTTVKVMALNQEEAEEKAIEKPGDYDYETGNANYEVV